MFNIKEERKKLPDSPGVYLHKDKLGQVIYVGKGNSLRKRVNQYFQSSKNMDGKVRAMVNQIAEFEYITCNSEMEAFVLEDNLIKKYKPKYNILLRDDKTYPYIQVTTKDRWPKVEKKRQIQKNRGQCFGPYSDVGAVNQTIELLNNVFSLKRCSMTAFPKNMKPCLHYHMHDCDGMCIGRAREEEYQKKIQQVLNFLKGKNKEMITYLREEMEKASQELRYEDAGKFRDYMLSAKALEEKQRVVLRSDRDMDMVLPTRDNFATVFFIRKGKLVGRETYKMDAQGDLQKENLLNAFLRQHYGGTMQGPSEILVNKIPAEATLIEQHLSGLWNHKVTIHVPKKGEKKALLTLGEKNVKDMEENILKREKNKEERERIIKTELDQLLDIAGHSCGEEERYSVEAYDISNTNGVDIVGGAVSFTGNVPNRKAYRRFKVKTVEGSDDYASMQEVLFRRLRRGVEGEDSFLPFPQIIFVDGGKGHVGAAEDVLKALKLSIPVFGLGKDDHHRTKEVVFKGKEGYTQIPLKNRSVLFAYLGRIQEEVHRFAISYHRSIRDGKTIRSVLDEIEGIGPKKRNALLGHFGSVDKIKKASLEELMEVPGITKGVGIKINEYFH